MLFLGSGCGSVGRAVTYDTRGPRFESSHWQKLHIFVYCQLCIERTKIKKKRPGMAHLKKCFSPIELQVESVTQQVVSGLLYTVKFELGTTICVKNQQKLSHQKLHQCQLKDGKGMELFRVRR